MRIGRIKVTTMAESSTEQIAGRPDMPLGEIALMLSGGGYRAAAFHLGTLSMLKKLDLLKDVSRLSTISGGTIIGAKYALELSKNPNLDFQKFESEFKAFLAKTNVIAEALSRLNATTRPNSRSLTPSLIRSAASVYADADFVGDSTLGSLRRSVHGINEISFTSTDFFSGTRFRFQYSHKRPRVATGSSSVRVRHRTADEIRLSDIIAASSCFPGGFEPLFFPADFSWARSIEKIEAELGPKYKSDIPLMDGGIIDNQGIDGIKDFLERADGKTNLCIISDSSPRNSKLYDAKSKKRSLLSVPLWVVLLLIIFLFATSLATIFVLGREGIDLLKHGQLDLSRAILNYLFPVMSAVVVTAVIAVGGGLFIYYRKEAETQIRGPKGWLYFLKLSLPGAFQFAKSRIASVLTMTTDVFMGRIRSLSYTSVFSNKELSPLSIANLIYDLDDRSLWKNKVPEEFFPTPVLRELAKNAEGYDTTLNFDGCPETLDILVEAGKATMCFNLLRYLIYVRKVDGKIEGHPLNPLFEMVKTEWGDIQRKSNATP